jgi:hypothetical protein
LNLVDVLHFISLHSASAHTLRMNIAEPSFNNICWKAEYVNVMKRE